MTPRQKRILAILAVADVVVILALATLVVRSLDTGPVPASQTEASLPSPRSTSSTETLPDTHHTPQALLQDACQWQATQLLAEAGLSGAVTLTPDGLLRFDTVVPLAAGQTADDAAQSVWTAFDVALALGAGECDIFTQVAVTILAQGEQGDTQIGASVGAVDLAAFGAGELDEDEFIERVAYTVGSRS